MTARWYIVHAYSNFEKKVAESIEEQARQKGLSDRIEQVVVPTEKVVEVRRGRKVDAERKFFPGYVLVKAELTDAVFSLIKNTPKVTGFLGDSRPVPITEAEAQRILTQVQEGVDRPKPSVTFEIGEQVRVSDGPFASFNGYVQEVTRSARGSKSRFRSSGVPCPSIWSSVRSRRPDRRLRFSGAEGWKEPGAEPAPKRSAPPDCNRRLFRRELAWTTRQMRYG